MPATTLAHGAPDAPVAQECASLWVSLLHTLETALVPLGRGVLVVFTEHPCAQRR